MARENAPFTSRPGMLLLPSATERVATPAVEMTLAVSPAVYSRATPGVKAGNAAGPPTFRASVAGTAPPMSPPTGVEVAGPLPVCVLVSTGTLGLVDRARHVGGARARGEHRDGRARVGLRAGDRPRCRTRCGSAAVDGLQRRVLAARRGGADDLRRVRVIGADDDQRVGVRLLERLGDADGVVHADQLTDLPAGVGGVIALVDRRALDLEHEALVLPCSS